MIFVEIFINKNLMNYKDHYLYMERFLINYLS
jgi:hypothetical protein